MRRLIAIALSLLCIALPLRTVADAALMGEHCPRMQAVDHSRVPGADMPSHDHANMHASTQSTPAAPADKHSCCNDAATFASTGQLCKMGQQCSPPLAYLLPPAVLQVAVVEERSAITETSSLHYTRPPTAVWRPPSLS